MTLSGQIHGAWTQYDYFIWVASAFVTYHVLRAWWSSPFAALNGTDNQVAFTTMRYQTNPLVITGPGAGPAVTAAGVLNDILTLATS